MEWIEGMIGVVSFAFIIAWVWWIFIYEPHNEKCHASFNNAPRFCSCGGARAYDHVWGGNCTDHCTSCKKVTMRPSWTYLLGHQCNESTIRPDGHCDDCGRSHGPRRTQHAYEY